MMKEAEDQINALLRQRHRIPPNQDNDFTVRNLTEVMASAEQSANVMSLLLGAIASISLIVGGIGIMNIMLVSVTERTREIGIRIAVGAKSKDILLQFLIESLVLSLMGGSFGNRDRHWRDLVLVAPSHNGRPSFRSEPSFCLFSLPDR